MRLFDFFRPRPAIRAPQDLALFIDEQAAFVVQKGIFEYSRARAGHYAKVLFGEQAFLAAVDRSRWCAYPIGLIMVTEVAAGVLRQQLDATGRDRSPDLRALTLSVFDGYHRPEGISAHEWNDARATLEQRLQRIGLDPPRRSFEVADPYVQEYFGMMPIHEKLRMRDFPTIHNYLKLALCNVHDELTKRLDATALTSSLGHDRT